MRWARPSTRRRGRAGRPSRSRSRRSARDRAAASTAPGRPGAPVVLATYVDGGLGDLAELVHEGGHALSHRGDPDATRLRRLARLGRAHRGARGGRRARRRRARLAGAAGSPRRRRCRRRPRSAAATPTWCSTPPGPCSRSGSTPTRTGRPNEVWTAITADYLGIAPHPEWSWWAMRGQLVQEPGYMANYSVGAVLAADLRAAIRAARGDWTDGDPGWYGWVSRARLPVRAGTLRGRRAARRPRTPTGRARAARGDRPGPRLSDGRR